MDKGLTAKMGTDSLTENALKGYARIPPEFSAQFVCPNPKVWDLKKNFLWELVVRDFIQRIC